MALFDKQHNQRVLRHLRNQGIEITPSELIVERKKTFASIRRRLRERGFHVPDTDEELLQLILKAQAMGGEEENED